MLVLLLFFCSGATALVYEVLWSKYLTFMLGSTVQAQTVVLAVFMGGLAIGNRVFGRRSKNVVEPLRSYAILELIIGTYAFFFPKIYRVADFLFVQVGSAVVDLPVLPLAVKLLVSVALLLPPTILMGGTLPLLAMWIQRQSGWDAGARVGIFYAVNSLGAVVGAGLAGFFLVQSFGLISALELTALLNLFVGFFAVILAKRDASELSQPAQLTETPSIAPDANATGSGAWFGMLVAVTGGVSMGLEVATSRALALIAGGSVQSFALVLMSFILGIGLGSVVISSSRFAKRLGSEVLYVLLITSACLVVVHVLMIEKWAILYTNARYGLAQNPVGYIWHQIAVGLLAFVILGLPAAFLGAAVPLAIRLVNIPGAALGDKVGRLLTWNTVGAVAGVLVTGFILMPLAGLRTALAVLGIAPLFVAGVIGYQRKHSGILLVSVLLATGATAGVVSTGEKWRWVIGGGLFRTRNFYITEETMKYRKSVVDLKFYKDSADATVSVEEGPFTNNVAQSQLTLRINGKTDASSAGDIATQYLLAHLPMMARPDATNVFVLGFGSGITGGALLGHPIQQLTIAENCKPVLEAGPLFGKWNRGVLTNSRTRVFNDDARAVLKLRPDKYDIIVSEPSNPWVVGVGSVFNQDFYKLCANRLSDRGVMAQWFHKYEMADDIAFLIFRTFASVFPNMEIWDFQEGDLILLGSKAPWPSDPAHYQPVFDRAEPAKDLAALRISTPAQLWTRQVASQKIGAAIPGDGPIQSDEFPLLEYAAPKAFFVSAAANHMYFFDERTVQFTLADRAKIEALRAVPNKDLLATFSSFLPSNPDILLYLQAISGMHNAPRLDPMGHIIFRPSQSYPEDGAVRPGTRPEVVECVKAEAGLLRDDANWKLYAGQIEKVLTTMIGNNDIVPKDFGPKYFAALAARCAIGHGDYITALRVLRLGFVFDAYDEQLQFLSRVNDRIVPPEILQKAKAADKFSK